MKFLLYFITSHHQNIKFFRRTTFIFILLLSGVFAVYIFNSSPKSKIVQTLPQDNAIKVYFNYNPGSSYEDPYRHFTRKGDNLEQQIIDAIHQAHSTVDFAVMEFRLPKVAQALILAHQRGVKVRMVIDNKYNKNLAEYTPEKITRMNRHDQQAYKELKRYPADALALLRSHKIEIKDDTSDGANQGSGIMHHKFVVIDEKTTLISSGNMTTSDMHGDFGNFESRGNPNNLIVVSDNSQLAQTFTNEFNYMWRGLFKSRKPKRYPETIPLGTGTITVNFSPSHRKDDIATTSNGIIASYLQQVKKSVHIAVFVYSDQKISDTLGSVHDQGVEDIKVLIDADFFRQSYSKSYDALGVCPRPGKKQSFIRVKPWKRPITTVGYPTGSLGDRGVHSKMAILDAIVVITGSHNWSNSGNYFNDETLVFIQNSLVAAHYEQEFSRLYQTANLGLKTLPSAQKCELVNSKNAVQSSQKVKPNTVQSEE